MASGGSKPVTSYALPEGSPSHLVKAHSYLGTYEKINDKSNPVVEKFIKKFTKQEEVDAANVPWCAYWLGYVLEEAGYSSTKSGSARSYLNYGEMCGEEVGAIVVFWRGTVNDGITGHVGFLIKSDDKHLYVLGGNQGDAVSVQRFTRAKLLGFRKPRALTKSRTIRAAVGAATAQVTDKVVDTIPTFVTTVEEAKGPLEQLSEWMPEIKLFLTIVTISCIFLTVFYRIQDSKEKGR